MLGLRPNFYEVWLNTCWTHPFVFVSVVEQQQPIPLLGRCKSLRANKTTTCRLWFKMIDPKLMLGSRVIALATRTMHYSIGNPSKLPNVCNVWPPQMGNLMTTGNVTNFALSKVDPNFEQVHHFIASTWDVMWAVFAYQIWIHVVYIWVFPKMVVPNNHPFSY